VGGTGCQQDEERPERDEDPDDDADEERRSCEAVDLVCGLTSVSGLLHGRAERVANEAFVTGCDGELVVLHEGHDDVQQVLASSRPAPNATTCQHESEGSGQQPGATSRRANRLARLSAGDL
jgi:hypothetical protein